MNFFGIKGREHQPLSFKTTDSDSTSDSQIEKVEAGKCCSESTVYKTALFVGVVITTLGALFLAGLLIPNAGNLTPFLNSFGKLTTQISTALGACPYVFSSFVTAIGGSLVIVSLMSLVIQKCKSKPAEGQEGVDKLHKATTVN